MSRRGDWMQTYTGRQFWPLDPRVEDIDIMDIAHPLSMMTRYNGHCYRFYSIAEHCVLISEHVAAENALAGLLHDAAEAYLGDLIRPMKPFIADYKEIERRLEGLIWKKFGLAGIPEDVSLADYRILNDERDQLFTTPPEPWSTPKEYLGVELRFWSPRRARAEFLARFKALTGEKV